MVDDTSQSPPRPGRNRRGARTPAHGWGTHPSALTAILRGQPGCVCTNFGKSRPQVGGRIRGSVPRRVSDSLCGAGGGASLLRADWRLRRPAACGRRAARRGPGRQAPRRSRRARASAPPRGRPRRHRRSRASRPGLPAGARAPARAGCPFSPPAEISTISGSRSLDPASSSSSSGTSIHGLETSWSCCPAGRIETASASTRGARAATGAAAWSKCRIQSTHGRPRSLLRPAPRAAPRASASLTRTMIAIPSPSEIRWLRRRVGPTCWPKPSDSGTMAVGLRHASATTPSHAGYPAVGAAEPDELIVREPVHLLRRAAPPPAAARAPQPSRAPAP